MHCTWIVQFFSSPLICSSSLAFLLPFPTFFEMHKPVILCYLMFPVCIQVIHFWGRNTTELFLSQWFGRFKEHDVDFSQFWWYYLFLLLLLLRRHHLAAFLCVFSVSSIIYNWWRDIAWVGRYTICWFWICVFMWKSNHHKAMNTDCLGDVYIDHLLRAVSTNSFHRKVNLFYLEFNKLFM